MTKKYTHKNTRKETPVITGQPVSPIFKSLSCAFSPEIKIKHSKKTNTKLTGSLRK